MKKLFLFLILLTTSCTTIEPYYRAPLSYEEKLEADANPQNQGYVLRHREVVDADGILSILYVATAAIDLVNHVHHFQCRHD